MKRWLLLLGLTGLTLSGCTSSLGVAPATLLDGACDPGGLPGVWSSPRGSQLGPAGMRLELGCDCQYKTTARVFGVLRLKERGPYRIDGDNLVLGRATGEKTVWPLKLEGESLWLKEGGGESLEYRLKRPTTCGS